ncbi:MAG: beta-propeller fold lactonase family protein [Granulicella sp.]
MGFTSRIALSSLLLVAVATPAISQTPAALSQTSAPGAVFAMTNRTGSNEIIAFKRSARGTLTQTGRYSTGGNGIGVDFDTQGGLRLSDDHRTLYACNPGSDNVSVFEVEGSELKLIQKVYAGDQPLSLTLSGDLLYVLDGSVASTQITGFRIGFKGTLTALPNSTKALSSPIAVPGEISFSPNGNLIAVTQKVDSSIGPTIDIFRINKNGLPSDPIANRSYGKRPFAEAFRKNNQLLVVESGLPAFNETAVSSYDVNRPDGTLTPITGSAKNDQTDGCWIVITEDQKYAYTANFVSGTISSYRLNRNGSVTLISGSEAFQGLTSQPTDLAFSEGSHYLYNLLRGTGAVSAFVVNDDGNLAALGVYGAGGGIPVADGASGLAAY